MEVSISKEFFLLAFSVFEATHTERKLHVALVFGDDIGKILKGGAF